MSWFARRLAGRDMLAVVRANKPMDWDEVARKAAEALQQNEVVGLPLDAAYPSGWLERLFETSGAAPVLPVRVDAKKAATGKVRRLYLLAGEPLKPGTTVDETRRAVERLAANFKGIENNKSKSLGFAPAS